jgi:integrase
MPRAPKSWIAPTKRAVDALKPRPVQPGRPVASAIVDVYFDESAPRGFHVRVYPNGRKVFGLRYRDPAGGDPPRYRRVDLGEYGPLTVNQARDKAAEVRARLEKGEAPHADKAKRTEKATVAQLVQYYVAEELAKKKTRHAAETRRLLDKHVVPTLGRELVAAVAGRDLQRLHASLSGTPILANRVAVAASGLFTYAMRRGDATSNPAAAVTHNPEPARDVEPLTDAQAAALGAALADAAANGAPWQAVEIVRFLFLSGCRREEAARLRWDEVDRERSRLVLHDSKGTKKGQRRTDRRYIGAPTLEQLDAIAERHRAAGIVSPYVFPSPDNPAHPYANLPHHWRRFRVAAGLPALRLHDLRHDVGSDYGMRYPGAVIQAVTGHASLTTVQRYVHAKDDPMARAADDVTTDRAARLNARITTADVLPITRRRAR